MGFTKYQSVEKVSVVKKDELEDAPKAKKPKLANLRGTPKTK